MAVHRKKNTFSKLNVLYCKLRQKEKQNKKIHLKSFLIICNYEFLL